MSHRRLFNQILSTALVVIPAACGPSQLLGPDASQGIEGIALLGPLCPVENPDEPCPARPYQAWIYVRREDRSLVTRVRSGEDGRFRVGLRPGFYLLDPESGNPFPTADDLEVDVLAGAYTVVTVSFDSGIR